MKSRSIWFLWPLICLPLVGGAILFFYPKLLTGDYAEITIESVTCPAPGEIEIRYRGRISRGTWLDEGTGGGRGFAGSSSDIGRPERLEGTDGPVVLKIYTVRNGQGRLATPREVLERVAVKPGKTYRVHPDRALPLLRYVAHDGEEVDKSFRVGPLSPP